MIIVNYLLDTVEIIPTKYKLIESLLYLSQTECKEDTRVTLTDVLDAIGELNGIFKGIQPSCMKNVYYSLDLNSKSASNKNRTLVNISYSEEKKNWMLNSIYTNQENKTGKRVVDCYIPYETKKALIDNLMQPFMTRRSE